MLIVPLIKWWNVLDSSTVDLKMTPHSRGVSCQCFTILRPEVSHKNMVFISWCISIQEPSGNHTPPQLSPSLSQSTYTTGGSLDVPHIIMQGDARRRRNENYFDDIPRSKLERQMAQVRCSEPLWCFCLFPRLSTAFRFWTVAYNGCILYTT